MAYLTIVLFLIALGVNMFFSEQKRIIENKNLTKSKTPAIAFEEFKLKHESTPGSFEIIEENGGVIAEIKDRISDKDFAQLSNRPVNILKLDQSDIDGSGLALVYKPAVLELQLRDTKVTDENLKNLVGMNKLSILVISSDAMSDEGLKYIGSLKSLTNLSLKSNKITADGIKHLRNLANLESIHIDSNALTDDSLDALSSCQFIRFIHLNGSSMSPDMGVKLATFKNLTHLDVENMNGLSHKSLDAIMRLEHLSRMDLDCGAVDEGAFVGLSQSKRLKFLNLKRTKFNPRWLSHLQKMSQLQSIAFTDSKSVSDQLIDQLISLKGIYTIFFTGSNINDRQFLRLTQMKNLEYIDINHCPNLTDGAIDAFPETFQRIWKKECQVVRGGSRLSKDEFVR